MIPGDGEVIKKEQIDFAVGVAIQIIHQEFDVPDPVPKQRKGLAKTVGGYKECPVRTE